MYLEKLEVQGFKSFANKNKLIFSGLIGGQKRGLTAIVGPNGSGKSNVADSIRWALGEQSLKTLRGKKSEDVIFSGSDQKTQLGLAEVSLYLNNAEAVKNHANEPAAIEKESDLDQIILSCPEIVITRRLYRNGDSEYLLNSQRVRLADIQMLLAKANFGQKTYSVIGQGMVESFLSSSAADRKDFFDEATGVKQFQIKRDSALNKLEASYTNLQQVDMLLTEIKPRLKSLTRSVEKLKHRGEIEQNLRADQLSYYGWLWQDINTKLAGANGRLLENDKIRLEREKKLSKLNEDLNKIRLTDNFQKMAELEPRLKELENQRNQYLKELTKWQAEQEIQFETRGQFDLSWLTNKENELKAELTNINLEIATLATAVDQAEGEWQTRLTRLDQELLKSEEARRQSRQREEEKDPYLKQIARLDATLEANLEVQGQFDVSWLNNKQVELSSEAEKLIKELSALRQTNDSGKKITLEKNLKEIQDKLASASNELNKINHRLKSAEPDGEQSAALGKLIKEFLARLETIGRETSLERIKKLLAEAKIDFQDRVKNFIDRTASGDWVRLEECQDQIIKLTEEREEINNQLAAERLRLATSQERERLFEDKNRQLQRELAEIQAKLAKAQIKFDANKIQEEKESLIKKIAVLDRASQALSQQDQSIKLIEEKQALLEKLQASRLKNSTREERRHLLQTKKTEIQNDLEDIHNKITKSQVKSDPGELAAKKKILDNKLSELERALKILSDERAKFNQAKEQEKAQMFEYQKNIQSAQQEINEILTGLNNLRIEVARQETKLEDLENNIRGEGVSLLAIKNYQTDGVAIDLERLHKSLMSNKAQLEQIGGIDPEAAKEYQETKERYDFLSKQTADLNQAIKSLEEIIYELDLNIKNRFDSEFKLIAEKFNEYFKILFSGGSAKIFKVLASDLEKEEAAVVRTDPKDQNNGLTLAETAIKNETTEKLNKIKFLKKNNAAGLAGVEVQATPPGKKIQTVTMLSGGERALTAIALICAIISANPSPFVVLDEVDAALDEANSERLAKILDDLSNKTQFIIITHNRACMRKASILYGVTMEADGVSKLLSVKLDELKK